MKIGPALSSLMDYGLANALPAVIAAEPVVDAIRQALGDLDTTALTAAKLNCFLRQSGLHDDARRAFAKASERWEGKYAGRTAPLPWESDQPVETLCDLLRTPGLRPGHALELGCGDGANALLLAQHGWKVTVVDISATALSLAKQRLADHAHLARFVHKNIFDLNFEPRTFDLVFDRGCLHHVPVTLFEDYKRLVADWLAPGGVFHLVCHSGRAFVDRYTNLYLGETFAKLLRAVVDEVTESFFTEAELREIFSDRFLVESVVIFEDATVPPVRIGGTTPTTLAFLACVMTPRSAPPPT